MMPRFFNATVFRGARRAAALLAAAALLNAAGPARAATESARRPAPTGEVALAAGLSVDGLPAVSGQTVFTGSSFSTEEKARGMVELGNRARVELSGWSALKLDFSDEALGGALDKGSARLSVPRDIAATLTTADASVASDRAETALFTLQVSAEGTTLTVQSGRVEMRAGGAARTAGAGESLHAARGSQPSPPPQANNLSGKKKAGLFFGIAGAVAVIILILAGGDDDEVEEPCPVIVVSGDVPPGC